MVKNTFGNGLPFSCLDIDCCPRKNASAQMVFRLYLKPRFRKMRIPLLRRMSLRSYPLCGLENGFGRVRANFRQGVVILWLGHGWLPAFIRPHSVFGTDGLSIASKATFLQGEDTILTLTCLKIVSQVWLPLLWSTQQEGSMKAVTVNW